MSEKKKSLIVVPMKDPKISKSRLNDALAPEARERLATLLFKNTIDVLLESVKLQFSSLANAACVFKKFIFLELLFIKF